MFRFRNTKAEQILRFQWSADLQNLIKLLKNHYKLQELVLIEFPLNLAIMMSHLYYKNLRNYRWIHRLAQESKIDTFLLQLFINLDKSHNKIIKKKDKDLTINDNLKIKSLKFSLMQHSPIIFQLPITNLTHFLQSNKIFLIHFSGNINNFLMRTHIILLSIMRVLMSLFCCMNILLVGFLEICLGYDCGIWV